MKIYVASSWRNIFQPGAVNVLRTHGHEVYDFRHPTPDDNGFHWSEVSHNWEEWTTQEWRGGLTHPRAEAGFRSDFEAMEWCDTMILIMPCGRSAHLEMGWAVGAGKRTCYYADQGSEPELKVKMCDYIATDIDEIEKWLDI